MVVCRVILLDQESFQVELAKNSYGQVLFDNVKQKLNLEEADYFGVSYRNSHNLRFWLNLNKRIDKQVESTKDMVFYWEVKFYPPAPEQLNEDLTRYLIVLQIRQDLFSGALPASFQTLAILGSYTAQGEIGDFDKTQHIGIDYLRPYSFAPKQSEELLMRISDLHKTCKGLTPAEADLYFLDNAKRCAMYGMDMYPVKDSANREVKVGVSASGLYIYHGRLRMESFKWPRMLKISYKTNIFRIKVRPAEFEHHQQSLGFRLPTDKLAKRLWRVAVENHQFFRLKQPEYTDTSSLRGFGSRKWRMSGRTLSQLRNVGTPRKSFSRTNSLMLSEAGSGLHQSVGTMPVPANRYRDPDENRNYNTFNGHSNKGMDRFVDVSYDNGGEYVPGEALNDSAMSRNADPSRRRRPPADSRPHAPGADNLVNGGQTPEPDTDILTSQASRTQDGEQRRPSPKERLGSRTEGLHNGLGDDDRPVEVSAVTGTGLHRLPSTTSQPKQTERSTSDAQPSIERKSPSLGTRPSAAERYHSQSSQPSAEGRNPSFSSQPLPAERYQSLSSQPSVETRIPTVSSQPLASERYLSTSSQPSAEGRSLSSSSQPVPAERYHSISSQPSVEGRDPSSSSQPPVDDKHSSSTSKPSATARTPDTISRPSVAGKFGIGELPMPSFSLESAGVMPTGRLDNAVKLNTSDRAEKVIKVGVPPTVKTTCMKFAGSSAEPSTSSTWSPPIVKTEIRQFKYTPRSQADMNGYHSSGHERISETTTYTTERDGYIEKKVKHTITISGDEDIDDKLLLDAIQAVTGLDSTLGVDKIEIKTESECP